MILKNKVALVSGATSGMGKAIALLFASEGARVVVNGRDEARGAETVDAIQKNGGEARFVRADVSQADQVEALVAETIGAFGTIDILVPNSGVLGLGSATEVPLETWDQTIGTNLNGVFYLCRYAIPHIVNAGGGSIVINASIAAFKSFPNHPAYCASKGALVPLAKNLAIDYASQNIRVNCLCPGPVDTPMIWESADAFPNPEEAVQNASENTLLKRLGTPEDVARAALFLASDQSAWITGAALPVDGGIMA